MTAKIYIKPYDFKVMTWDNVTEIPFTEYSIDESDFRNKTAKFKTDQFYDVSSKSWAVKIVNPDHETFAGIILKRKINRIIMKIIVGDLINPGLDFFVISSKRI